jgi:negative regulator of sigma E activity
LTAGQRTAARDTLAAVKEWSPVGAFAIAVGYCVFAIITALVGPLIPKSQQEQEALRTQLTVVQATQTAQLNSIQAQQTAQFSEMKQAQERMMARLDTMPRPSDYDDQKQHLVRIDNAFGAVGDRFQKDELETKGVEDRVKALEEKGATGGPYRNPQGSGGRN